MYPALPLFSDRTKRRAILWPTRPLPPAQRVSLRQTLLRRLEIGKARRAPMIVVAHQKSGNTWLRTMISRYFQVKYGLPSDLIAKSDELHRRRPAIPPIFCTNGHYSYQSIIAEALDKDPGDPILRRKPVLFISRHPGDLAVSWYFQFTKRQSAAKQELINHFIDHPINRHTVEMWDFVRHSDIGLPCLIEFLNTWHRNLQELEGGTTIRYEDLRAEPGTTLKQVVQLMGDDFSDAEIDEAVQFGSFDNLRQMESKGFFRQGGMKLRNPDDPTTFKVRRGKVGGYRDYFTPEQAAELEQLVRERLNPVFGYAPSATDAEPVSAHG